MTVVCGIDPRPDVGPAFFRCFRPPTSGQKYHGAQDPKASGLSIVFYDLPKAKDFSTYDPSYAPKDPVAGTGSDLLFLNHFSWPSMMYTYLEDQYPPATTP